MHRLAAFVLGAASLIGCTDAPSGRVTVENDETVPLFSLVFHTTGSDASTADLLGTMQLQPGTSRLLAVDCGTYDIEVMVAGGDQPPGAGLCTIADQDVCASSTTFVIDAANCALDE